MPSFRSQFEAFVAARLERAGQQYAYESGKVNFVQPAKKRYYKPDFHLTEHGFYIEAKGLFKASDMYIRTPPDSGHTICIPERTAPDPSGIQDDLCNVV